MSVFRVPDLGEGLQEVQIVAWHVNDGDHVVADQPLVSVETDKAVVEIPSPASGTVARCYGEPGDVVPIGAPLVELDDGEPSELGTVVGTLPSGVAPASPTEPGAPPGPSPTGAGAVAAAPAVRHLASELGVDLARVRGSGPGDAITRADVERSAASFSGTASGPAPTPLRGVRRAMAANMTRSHASIVPATVTDDADVHDWASDTDTAVRLIRAVARACRAEPALNAWYLGPDAGVILWPEVHLGVAIDTEEGLFAPVLRDVGQRDPSDLRVGLDALTAAAHRRTIGVDELRGATISLSNFGSIAGRYGVLVIVPPQVAILGAGRLREQVVARGGAPAVRRVLPLSLTFDHRVVTGGEATRFLRAAIEDLQLPT